MEADNHDGHDPTDHDNHRNTNKTSSRWIPTKDQINMLEGLYKQGIRSPNAEQIQQITTMLSAFGHVKGKNIFFWFQNHKARQRQKQKQESMSYNNRFPHITPPNVARSPLYVPVQSPSEPIGALDHQSNASSLSIVTRTRSRKSTKLRNNNGIEKTMIDKKTLPLFPLCPTGDLQGNNHGDRDVYLVQTQSCDDEEGGLSSYDGGGDKTFYDFFSQ